jgi:hypothetical protein
MSDKTGGPAFPHSRLGSDHDGMTLRDYFAAMAMQGLIASPRGPADKSDPTDSWVAQTAYLVADAMLKERDK